MGAPHRRQRGTTVDAALESLIQDTVITRNMLPAYLKTTPFMHKLERGIISNPGIAGIAGGVVGVPTVALLWWVLSLLWRSRKVEQKQA